MKLRRLHIRRIPGIDDPFSLDGIDGGLQLVIGPNASGKSSICRAVRALLWPDDFPHETVSITGDLRAGDGDYQVVRERKSVSWQKNGIDAPAPDLPGSHVARCFTLGIPDLLPLHGGATDTEIASEIWKQISGGYDIRAVASGRFAASDRRGKNAERDLGKKNRDLNAIRAEQRDLAAEEDSLLRIEMELEEARKAQRELELLRRARGLARARRELEEVHRALEEFPPGMERLKGDEARRLRDLRTDLDAARRRIDDCDRNIALAIREQRECGLPHGPVDHLDIDAWADRARRLAQLETEIRTGARDHGDAVARQEAARSDLDPGPDPAPGVDLDAGALREIDAFLDRAARLQNERAALRAERGRLSDAGETVSSQALDRGIHLLRSWLSASAARSSGGVRRSAGLLLAAAAVAAVSGLAMFLVLPRLGAGLIGLGIGILATRFWWNVTRPGVDEAERVRRDYEQLGLRAPGSWSTEEIGRLLQELERKRADAAIAEGQRALLQNLEERERELEERERRHEEERGRIAERTGLDPGLPDLTLAVCAQRVSTWTGAQRECRVAAETLRNLQQAHSDLLEELNGFLRRHAPEPASDAAGALARITDLGARSDRYRAAQKAQARESDAKVVLQDDLAELERRADEFWSGLGVTKDDEPTLFNRLDCLDRFGVLAGRAQTLQASIRETRAEVAAESELLLLSVEEADERIGKAEQRAARLEDLQNRKGRIESRVEEARARDDMELALAGVEAALTELEEQREEALRCAAGRFLLQGVNDLYDRQSQPEVLQRARELFGRFTHHEYELLVDEEEGKPTFRALDTASSAGKSLSELSDATRLQLLLAARLAFAEQVERGVKLPLFLDEVLTTTDPARFRAIAESLLSMVGDEGRQVFYLSANPADAAHWNAILSRRGMAPVTPIELAKVRRLNAAADAGALHVPALEVVPEPGDGNAEQYGELLGVPRLDPELPLSRLHLYYPLRDDLLLLHSLLRVRIETVGQWRALVSSGGASGIVSANEAERIDLLVETCESFFEHYRVGRGRRVDGEVLQEAGVSSTYLDRFASLARDLDGDGRRFMAVLDEKSDERAYRFRDAQREELRSFLIENGHLDEREVLDEAGVRARVLSAIAVRPGKNALTAEEIVRRVHDLWVLAGGE